MGKKVDDLIVLVVLISTVLLVLYTIIAITYNTGTETATLILLIAAIVAYIGAKVL